MAKKRSQRFKKLHRLIQGREQEAAQALGRSQQRLLDSKNQLTALHDYRTDYFQQLQKQGEQGITGQMLNSYQGFLNQLDVAIEQQHKQIATFNEECDTMRRHWLIRRNRTQVIEKTMQRFDQREQVQHDRREQRELDDHSLRNHNRKEPSSS